MLTFDDILSNRIGFGKFQYTSFAILGFIDFLDGSEGMYVTLLNAILFKEWSLTIFQLILLGAIFNTGLFVGAILCSLTADYFGRKNLLVFATVIQVSLHFFFNFFFSFLQCQLQFLQRISTICTYSGFFMGLLWDFLCQYLLS